MVMRSDGSFTLEEPDAAASQLGVTPHTVSCHKVLSFFMPLWDWALSKYFSNQVRFTTKVILEDPGEVEAVLGRVQVDCMFRRASARSNFRRPLRRDFKAAISFWIGIVRESSKWNQLSFRCSLLSLSVWYWLASLPGGTEWRGRCERCEGVLGLHRRLPRVHHSSSHSKYSLRNSIWNINTLKLVFVIWEQLYSSFFWHAKHQSVLSIQKTGMGIH